MLFAYCNSITSVPFWKSGTRADIAQSISTEYNNTFNIIKCNVNDAYDPVFWAYASSTSLCLMFVLRYFVLRQKSIKFVYYEWLLLTRYIACERETEWDRTKPKEHEGNRAKAASRSKYISIMCAKFKLFHKKASWEIIFGFEDG